MQEHSEKWSKHLLTNLLSKKALWIRAPLLANYLGSLENIADINTEILFISTFFPKHLVSHLKPRKLEKEGETQEENSDPKMVLKYFQPPLPKIIPQKASTPPPMGAWF